MKSTTSALIDLVEAAYRLEPTPDAWLEGLADVGRHEVGGGVGAIAVLMDHAPGGRLVTRGFGIGAAEPSVRARLEQIHQRFGPMFEQLVHAGPLAGSALELVAGTPGIDALRAALAAFGLADVLGVVAHDGHGAVVGLAAPARDHIAIGVRRARLQRLGAHLGAAHRLRERLCADGAAAPQAVVTPRGKIVDATGDVAARRSARDALVEAVLHMEKARGRLRRDDPDLALSLWQGLVRGTWSLVESVERDGRRLLVAHANGIRSADPRALTQREAAVVTFVQTGLPNKVVGYTLGLSTSSVGTYLASAMKKLRLRTRAELISLGRRPVAHSLERGGERLAVLSYEAPVADEARLTTIEREVATLAARGLSNAAIAQARGRSERTIANQLARVFQKLGVGSRSELTLRLGASAP